MKDVGNVVGDIIEAFSKVNFKDLQAKEIGAIILFILVCFIAIKIILKMVSKFLKKSRIEESLHVFIKTSVKVILYLIAFVIISDKLGIGITFVTIFGVFGLAISLACQGLLSNIAGGITVIMTKPFVVHDFVDIGDANGEVVEISFIYTKINAGDNRIISIPNAKVVDSKIVNYSTESSRRVELLVSASYEDDIEKVKKSIKKVIDSNSLVLKDKEVSIRVKEYASSGINYLIYAWTKGINYKQVYFDLLEGIKYEFDKNEISMPYNQVEVKMK